MKQNLPYAKDLPGHIKIIDQAYINDIVSQAKEHPRARRPILLNKSFSEVLQYC